MWCGGAIARVLARPAGENSLEYIDFALRHPCLPWDWHTMTDTIIAFDALHMVFENPDAPWDWVWLSHKVPLATILSRQDLPWYWKEVTFRAAYELSGSVESFVAPWDFVSLWRSTPTWPGNGM